MSTIEWKQLQKLNIGETLDHNNRLIYCSFSLINKELNFSINYEKHGLIIEIYGYQKDTKNTEDEIRSYLESILVTLKYCTLPNDDKIGDEEFHWFNTSDGIMFKKKGLYFKITHINDYSAFFHSEVLIEFKNVYVKVRRTKSMKFFSCKEFCVRSYHMIMKNQKLINLLSEVPNK
ncbi:MAG: hypothetical protein ACOCQD_03345 [archaeon]